MYVSAAYMKTQLMFQWSTKKDLGFEPGSHSARTRTSRWGLGRGQWDQQDLWDLEEQMAPGEGIPSWEKTWNICLETRNPHGGFGLKLRKTFVFVPRKKKG